MADNQADESGDRLGKHVWDKEVLKETRGEFIYPRVRLYCVP
jgi:hypothetical protein